ncbi:MAG: hypothetical protein IPG69_09075 [Flavobacteriales bacterium]|nr:hypothetical protein [Flavobacteriales bacterium]
MLRKLHIALFMLLLVQGVVGQQDPLAEALRKYQEGALNESRALVEEAVLSTRYARDPEAWLLRGFILKDLYKSHNAEPQGGTLRDEALASLSTCLDLDTGLVYQDNATQAFEFLTKTCYNDAAKALNDLLPERAEALYLKYKRHAARTGGIPDEKAKEVEFYNALGTVHTKLYNQDRENLIWYDRALVTYHAVLKMDPENYGANYNLATLYYNRGVYNIQRVDVENDIPSLQRIQEVSREFFLEALPFMLKAFEMNPKRKETLLGLEGIYYSLQDPEKSEHYRSLFEQLGPQEEDR